MQPPDKLGELVVSTFKRVQFRCSLDQAISEQVELGLTEAVSTERKCAVRQYNIEQQLELRLRPLALRRERTVDDLDPPVDTILRDAAQIVRREHYLAVVVSINTANAAIYLPLEHT